MDVISEKVLIALKDLMTRIIASKELSRDFLTEANLAVMAIDYETQRQRSQGQYTDASKQKERALIADLKKQAGAGKSDLQLERRWKDIWSGNVGAELSNTLSTILNDKGTNDAEFRKVVQSLRAFLMDYYKFYDPVIEGGTATTYSDQNKRKGETSESAAKIDQETLEKYLRKRFDDSTRVTSFKKLAGGYSKETYMVDLATAKNPLEKIVLRKDGVGLPTGGTVVDEFDVIELARQNGIPAPQRHWIEPDPNVFGSAVMAVAFIEGQVASSIIPSDPATKRKWAEAFAELLAKIHKIRPKQQNFNLVDSFRRDIDKTEARIIDRERVPHPGLVAGIAWLRKNVGRLEGRPVSLVHGDVGFHNLMMRDSRIVGLLDWEFHHYCDPAEDLVYCKLFIDQLMPWAEFMETYKSHGGADYPDDVAQFFDVWKETRNSESCIGSLNSLLIPEVQDIKLFIAGCLFSPKFEMAAIDAMLAK